MRALLTILSCTLLCMLLFIGCKPVKEATTSATAQTTERTDSTVYVEILKKDTVLVKGDSIKVLVPVPCDTAKVVKGKSKSGRVNLNYGIKNGMLEIECNADSLLIEVIQRELTIYKLKRELNELKQTEKKVVTVTKTVTKYRTPFWNWIVMLILLAWIFRKPLVRLFKALVKIPLPWK